MNEAFSRTRLLLGDEGLHRLNNSAVVIFGIGGVGSFTAEALARSGVGRIMLVDKDEVCKSNINRQIIATYKTVGRLKVEVMRDRILEINPNAKVEKRPVFYTADNAEEVDIPLSSFSYVVDAIDTVSSKIALIERAKSVGVPIISSMGAGNKLDPTRFEVDDIYNTSVCPLARVMRYELRKRGIKSLKVVYSKEPPLPLFEYEDVESTTDKKKVPGSISFVPSVAGLILAGEVIKDIAGIAKV